MEADLTGILGYAKPTTYFRRPRIALGVAALVFALPLGLITVFCGWLVFAGVEYIFGLIFQREGTVSHSAVIVIASFTIMVIVGWICLLFATAGVRRIAGLSSIPDSWKNKWWLPFTDFD